MFGHDILLRGSRVCVGKRAHAMKTRAFRVCTVKFSYFLCVFFIFRICLSKESVHIFYDFDRFSDLSAVYKSRSLKVKCAFRTVECEIGSFS